MKVLYFIIGLISISMMGLSCKKDVAAIPIPPDCVDTISYSNFVQPLILANCATCHNGSFAGGSFTTYNEISINADNIYSAMSHDGTFSNMPSGGAKLADSLIQQVSCWISQGKLDN